MSFSKGEAVSQPLPQEDDLIFLSKRKGFRFSFAACPPPPFRIGRAEARPYLAPTESVHELLSTN